MWSGSRSSRTKSWVMMSSDRLLISFENALAAIQRVSEELERPAFVVGGAIRDLLMTGQVADKDLDITVEGSAEAVAKALAEEVGGLLVVHDKFLTAKLLAPFSKVSAIQKGLSEIDIATCRTETYEKPAALPTVTASSLERDLWRRDFTINAMAVDVVSYQEFYRSGVLESEKIVDPFNGRSDLKEKLIRIIHEKSFLDDPTRIFRAARYKVRIRGEYESSTRRAILDAVSQAQIDLLSEKRIFNELQVVHEETDAPDVLNELVELGVFVRNKLLSASMMAAHLKSIQELWTFDIQKSLREAAAKELLVLTIAQTGGNESLTALQIPKTEKKRILAALNNERDHDVMQDAESLALCCLTGDPEIKDKLAKKGFSNPL